MKKKRPWRFWLLQDFPSFRLRAIRCAKSRLRSSYFIENHMPAFNQQPTCPKLRWNASQSGWQVRAHLLLPLLALSGLVAMASLSPEGAPKRTPAPLNLRGQADAKTCGAVIRGTSRHGRVCPGHPRLGLIQKQKDVDARGKPGHDALGGGVVRRNPSTGNPGFSA